jgi:hypothetical protein
MRTVRFVFVGALLLISLSQARAGLTIYGSLGNFDCINDTGSTAHGFEIELDGISSSNVYSTFGAPYNRYGTPTITTVNGNTFVRYESTYSNGSWAQGTASGTYTPTGGHSLFYPQYGGTAAYPNVPGDHFGVALSATPTNTVYHWLLDPNNNGTLVSAGTPVMLPTPVLTVMPAANPVNPAAVQAVVQAPPAEANGQLSDAIWVKVFTTVVENPDAVQLNDLVLGNAVVPPNSETEVEWQLLQTDPANPNHNEKLDQGDVAHGNESITRRYEFYKYTGPYDPENHEALQDIYSAANVGDYLGNQNVAANFVAGAQVVPEPSTIILGGICVVCSTAIGAYRRRRSQSIA